MQELVEVVRLTLHKYEVIVLVPLPKCQASLFKWYTEAVKEAQPI